MFTLSKLATTTAQAALISLATIAPSFAASFYSVTELPFTPKDINDVGQIVGENYLWNDGILTDLRTLPGADTPAYFQAYAINNNGKIVGFLAQSSLTGEQAFISDGSTLTELSRPASNICSGGNSCSNFIATDINDAGQIVLVGLRPPAPIRYGYYGLFRDTNGTMTALFGGRYVSNLAINNASQVVGYAAGAGVGESFFFNMKNGTRTRMLPPKETAFREGYSLSPVFATVLNDNGQTAGYGFLHYDKPEFEFTWRHSALFWNDPENNPFATELDTLGGRFAQPYGINNASQVVGSFYTSSNISHAFLWENDTMLDLNNLIAPDLGWELSSALKINNQGQIVGYGFLNSQGRGFLLTPALASVPEPASTLSLLGFGAFGIGAVLRRTQKSNKIS